MGKLPENLSSLIELRISRTPLFDEAGLFASQLQADRIVVLSIEYCNSVTSLPFRILSSSLKRIMISHCQKLILEESVGYCNMFLEELRLREGDCIDDMSPELFPRARNLYVYSCDNLTRFLIPTATETLFIGNCKNVEKLSVACGGDPDNVFKY
uniref:Potato resistance I2GA-SH23-1 n=1 Tax=Solanum tuberosum TaxID=4113 RepID=M1BQP0_SOLTU